MTIHLYIDEDSMSHALVRALRARGVDVTTALDEGMIEREDAEHPAYATDQGRVLYSFNAGDFYHLHTTYLAQDKRHGGIILARQQHYSVGDQVRRILKLIATKSADDIKNQVKFLSVWD